MARQVNGISEGNMHAHHGARTAAPTTGMWAKGDFILNSNPVETAGTAHSYVVMGWECTVGGEPGTWEEVRFLTTDVGQPYSSVTTTAVDATLGDTYHTVYVTATGKTITLPDCTTARIGYEWTVHLATTGNVTISPNTGDTIILTTTDTTVALYQKGDSLTFRCISLTQWVIV